MSRWNHLLCDPCWQLNNPGRPPVRVIAADEIGALAPDPCCLCPTLTTSGIYVRHDPNELPCKGQGAVHDG